MKPVKLGVLELLKANVGKSVPKGGSSSNSSSTEEEESAEFGTYMGDDDDEGELST